MLHTDALGLLLGAVALGAVHGIEPGHGWPVAASYALTKGNKWLYGLAASSILGIGHLISSIAMVLAFFYAKQFFDLTRIDEPIALYGDIHVGGPVSLVAGFLLIGLGLREYASGHSHSHTTTDNHDHEHDHHESGKSHAHHDEETHHHNSAEDRDDSSDGLTERLLDYVPFRDGKDHSHADFDGEAERGLLGIAWFAFLLGFAHEEEFEIIALCAGSQYCLELMTAYALTVIVGIVGLTMLLIAGYEHFEEEVQQYTPYLPAISAIVLIVMGAGFIMGIY